MVMCIYDGNKHPLRNAETLYGNERASYIGTNKFLNCMNLDIYASNKTSSTQTFKHNARK